MPVARPAAFLALVIPLLSALSACGSTAPAPDASQASPGPASAGAAAERGGAPPPGAPAEASGAANAGTVSGTVAETMNSGGYTYARLTGPAGETWIAAPAMLSVQVGDPLVATINMPMENFRSRTLNREFAMIYFVSRVSRNGEVLTDNPAAAADMTMAGSHGATAAPDAVAPPVEPVPAAPDGLTIADVWGKRASLAGKPVTVRARVVKANYEIMGVNWYHLQDGSGTAADGTNDLTITSDAQARVGDVVTISGTLVTEKDFGAGYAYDAIVEKASIRKQ